MWRFYAIAALIVIAFGSLVFAHRMVTGDWDVRARPQGTPTITRGNGDVGRPAATFAGDGPWVLSALPSCFDQQSSLVGTPDQLSDAVPKAQLRVPNGTMLHAGPCTLVVHGSELLVTRGPDRLRVPADARLYRTRDGLVLVYRRGEHAEVRVYK